VKQTDKKIHRKPKKNSIFRAEKRKKRKKLALKDKIRAVLAAAVLVTLAAVVSAVVDFLKPLSGDAGEEIAFETGKEEPVSNTVSLPPPEEEASSPAPDSPPVSGVPPPANTPPAQAPVKKPLPETPSAAVPPGPARTVPSAPVQPAPAVPVPALPAAAVERPPEELRRRGVLVFVIDDAGNNLSSLEPFLRFPGPLTIAVLPRLPYSVEAARRIRAAGKEVILHQPMEALGGQNPGPGAVFAGMGPEEIREVISRNLDEIWPAAGLNNHEGSRVTMDQEAMETVLSLCRERGILFLDSRTTAETAAPRAAQKLGIKIGERDIFLDNSQDRDSMLHYLDLGLRRAEQKGAAVMIGHTWSPALGPLLTELYEDLAARGYSFSTLSEFVSKGK
jgi:polysaccharide deacetylase 2 family uncharacterized protein YibQ